MARKFRNERQRLSFELNKFEERMLKGVKYITRRKVMQDLGKFTLPLVKTRVRKGFGVRRNKSKRKLFPRNSRPYIEWRKENKGSIPPSGLPLLGGKAGKSNVTLTGQMVDSLKVYPTKIGRRVLGFRIEPTGRRRREKLTNQKLAEYLAKMNRVYLNLSDTEWRKVRAQFRRELRKFKKR